MGRSPRGPRATQRTKTADSSEVPRTPGGQRECDCPACTGQEVDPAQLFDGLLDDVGPLADAEDALSAELAGAAFLAMLTVVEEDALPAFMNAFIPEVESRPGRPGLAILRAFGSVAPGIEPRVAEAASTAADRMVAAGVPEPQWAAELAEPLQVAECVRLQDEFGALTLLVASFRRAGRGHAFVIVVDELHCAAAADIFLVDADQLPAALDDICADGHALQRQELDPAEFRWHAEEALEARAVHDEYDPTDETTWMESGEDSEDEDDEEPPYPVMAQLMRARLAILPKARRPADARSHAEADTHAPSALELFTSTIAGGSGGAFGVPGFGRPAPATLPAKRRKKDGPAQIYQIKVGLRGAKPPIWRRLLVPADLSLADLHDVIQAAFGWADCHMHVFETPYGDFGHADRELGHRAEAPVTLEQVAPRVQDKIRYTYDFGDDWEHEILVEKVLDRDPVAPAHPRCTGGRRAAPPDDCGGIWGYAELVEILTDPEHPDHLERLDWLGLDDPSHFDPAAFDVDEVNRALAKLR